MLPQNGGSESCFDSHFICGAVSAKKRKKWIVSQRRQDPGIKENQETSPVILLYFVKP